MFKNSLFSRFLAFITIIIAGCGGGSGGGGGSTTTYYQDADGDGYGDPVAPQIAASQPLGYVLNNTDCNDADIAVNPSATEINDGIDNNCDGQVDESFAYYQDADGDGYGDPAISLVATSQPAGYVLNNTDCDDADVTVNPSVTEVNDGIDNNCNGQVDETLTTSRFNDTGINWGGNTLRGNSLTCSGETISQQDCSFGRDATHNDNSDGFAGFSYTKLDASGNDLPASATSWSCVRDNVTSLAWEVKTDDDGLHDKDWSYTWYNSTGINDGGAAGYSGVSISLCGDNIATDCNTEEFVAKVNSIGLCGATDWRLPTIFELEGLINFNVTNPAVDAAYFPDIGNSVVALPSFYWSSTPSASQASTVWGVDFSYGITRMANKISYLLTHIRLVRTVQ